MDAIALPRQPTRRAWPGGIQELVDLQYHEAEKFVMVLDHLNTRTLRSPCDAFPPAEARHISAAAPPIEWGFTTGDGLAKLKPVDPPLHG